MALKEKVQRVMEQAVSECRVAGINLLAEKAGEEICYCQAGMADREENRPMERDTISGFIPRQSRWRRQQQ